MTMRGLVQFCRDLRDSYGPEQRISELPQGVLDAERIRAERAAATSTGGVAPGKATLGVAAYPSTVAPSPELIHPSTARTRRAE